MTEGQILETLRLRLGFIHGQLTNLVLTAPFAPLPAVNSPKYDAYCSKLTFLELELSRLKATLERMSRQGRGYRGSSEDKYQSRQRDASFQAQLRSVEAILKQCAELADRLLVPNKDAIIATGTSHLRAQVLQSIKDIGHTPPQVINYVEVVSAFVTLLIVALSTIRKKKAREQ